MDALFELTALPNLHPALVHFPIALAAVALLFDAVLLARRRWVSLDASGAFLWALAAAGAGTAYLAGRQAAEEAGLLESAAEVALGKHADAAYATLIALFLFALFRVWLAWRDRGADRAASGALRAFGLVGALAVQGLVAYTGDLGGALVYRHGIAVSRPGAEEASVVALRPNGVLQTTNASPPEYLEDGSLVWRPRAGDARALGETLEPIGANTVQVARREAPSEGISLATSGRTLLALPGSWEDARLEVRIDRSAFEGSVGLGARVEDEMSGGIFRIAGDGRAALLARSDGQEKILDEAQLRLPEEEVTIALSVSGRHWKGFVDGRSVVHGHASLPAPGRMAILLNGTGTLRVVSVRISPFGGESAPRPDRAEEAHQH
jgi:uncharacterized membrane protein